MRPQYIIIFSDVISTNIVEIIILDYPISFRKRPIDFVSSL